MHQAGRGNALPLSMRTPRAKVILKSQCGVCKSEGPKEGRFDTAFMIFICRKCDDLPSRTVMDMLGIRGWPSGA